MKTHKKNIQKNVTPIHTQPDKSTEISISSQPIWEKFGLIAKRLGTLIKIKDSILILNAGANFRSAYYTQDAIYSELPVSEITWQNLDRFSVIVIPAWSDQILLVKYQQQLIRFIKRGGILVQFGCHSMQWFPFLEWRIGENDRIVPTCEGCEAADILEGLDHNYLRWHTEFVSHGHFIVKHERTQVLANDENNNPILVKVEHGEGVALFTTLDPDFHVVHGTFMKNEADKRIAEAFRLLGSIMKWSVKIFNEKHSNWQQVWRRFRGLATFTTLVQVAYPFLFVFIVLSTVYSLIRDPSARQPIVMLSTVSGTVGLLMTIAQYVREKRIR
jgi:hypothetical protein